MNKQDMLDTIDTLVASIRRSEDDIRNLVDKQLNEGGIDFISYYYKHQCQYYRDNPEDFKHHYQWEFMDG